MKEYNHQNDWFYEGQISTRLVKYLISKGYKILKDNSGNIKGKGEDIIALSPEGMTEIIEVKGYPTEFYTFGPNKGERKRTNPKLQAKHWFSEAILSCMFNHAKHGDKKKFRLVLAFPSLERYKELLHKVEAYYTHHNIDFKMYLIDEAGNVEVNNLSIHQRQPA